jgi:hypothetical protein
MWRVIGLGAIVPLVLSYLLMNPNIYASLIRMITGAFPLLPALSTMRSEQLQREAIQLVRSHVDRYGQPPEDSAEVTIDVVRILQLGYGGDVTYGYEDLLGQVNDVILSTANWTDFSNSDLKNAIRQALEMLKMRKRQRG